MNARLHTITTVFRKEVLETFRDRKTILLAVLVPIILYPVLLLVLSQVAASHQAELASQNSHVELMGVAPDHPLVEWLVDWPDIDVAVHADDRVDIEAHAIGIDLTDWSAEADTATHPVRVYYRSVDDHASLALDRVEAALQAWAEDEIERRLALRDLPPSVAEPLAPTRIDTSQGRERGGHLLASLVPIFLLLTLTIGMVTPAVDLTAGERERFTIQTLFTAPVHTLDVVLGKAGALVLMGLITGTANLASLGLLFSQQSFLAGEGLGDFEISLPPGTLLALAAAMVLLAVLVGSFFLCAALLGQDTREAQSFLSPALLLAMIPSMVVQLPGFELTQVNATIPIINGILLVKQILLTGPDLSSLALVAGSTLVHATLLLLFASWLLGHEGIVTGRATSLRWFVPRRTRTPRDTPSTSEVVGWYGVGFALLFYVGATLQAYAPQPGLLVTLWGLLLAPTVAWAWYTRVDLRTTFRLRAPRPRTLAASVLLGSSVFILLSWAQHALGRASMGLDEAQLQQLAEQMAEFFPRPENAAEAAWLFFVVGVSPAICEELLFRGYILSGLRRSLSWTASILVCALLFALFHMSGARLPGTFVLGAILGVLALSGGSIWPAILFHGLNNGLLVLLSYALDDGSGDDPFAPWRGPALAATLLGATLVVLDLRSRTGRSAD